MIAAADLHGILAFVEAQGLGETTVAKLRRDYDYHFTYCSDDDMEANTPAYERPGFNVYLVNSSSHCSVLTRDPAQASGLVLAEIVDE